MANNFGSGYPGKTWKDAAAEVAWNRVKSNSEAKRNVMDMQEYLSGGNQLFAYENYFFKISQEHRKHCIFWRMNDKESFRAAFMKWLKENERREGCQM